MDTITTMAFNFKRRLACDICGDSKSTWNSESEIEHDTVNIKKEKPEILLPGCEGSIILNEHLKAYFIVTKLFKSHNSQFITLLPTSVNSRSQSHNEDERILYSSICVRCEGIVDKALDLHGKILGVQKEIDKLGDILREWYEIGRITRNHRRNDTNTKGDKSQVSSKGNEIQEKVLDSSLACLGGIIKDVKEKKVRMKSVRSSVRSRSIKNVRGMKCRDPSEPGIELGRNDEKLEFEKGVGSESPLPPVLGLANVDADDHDNDDDMDYVPTASSDEEMELDDENSDNEEYVCKGPQKEETPFPDEDEAQVTVTKEHLSSIPETNVTSFEYQCPECLRIFSKRQNLHKHTKDIHGFDMHYSCPRCPDLKFFKKRLLIEHRIKEHATNGTECDICGKQLKGDRENLFQHYQHFHKIKYPCLFCKMTFTTRLALKNHKQMAHTLTQEEIVKLPINRAPKTEEEKEWANNPCSDCGKTYVSGRKLDHHLMTKHEFKLTQEERKKIRRKCYFCWKILCLEQRHKIHCKLDHPQVKLEFRCDQCTPTEDTKAVYQTTADLLKHFEEEHTGSTIHTCSQCKQPFLNEASLKSHVKVHVNKKVGIPDAEKMVKCPFKCWFCWELFSTEEALQKHLKGNKRHWKLKVEFPCDDFECEYNQKPFSTLDQLNAHLSDHGNQKLFRCERCSWSFLSKEMLSIHEINHVPKLNGQFACTHPSCDHTVNFWRQLKDHYNVEHGLNLKLYRCSYCDSRFTMKRSLSSHMGNMHKEHKSTPDPNPTASPGYPCEKCGKLCPTEKYLYHHLYRNHKDLKCQDCDKKFESLGKYLYHRKVYHGVGNPHMCAICGKVFAQRNALTRHMGSHGNTKFECHLCGKKMYTLATLQTHIKKFHGDNDKKKKEQGPSPFQCGECGQGYSRKDSLEDHVRVKHTTDNRRVWSCDKCGKRFTRKSYLDAHVKSKKACSESVTIMQVEMDSETGNNKL